MNTKNTILCWLAAGHPGIIPMNISAHYFNHGCAYAGLGGRGDGGVGGRVGVGWLAEGGGEMGLVL